MSIKFTLELVILHRNLLKEPNLNIGNEPLVADSYTSDKSEIIILMKDNCSLSQLALSKGSCS